MLTTLWVVVSSRLGLVFPRPRKTGAAALSSAGGAGPVQPDSISVREIGGGVSATSGWHSGLGVRARPTPGRAHTVGRTSEHADEIFSRCRSACRYSRPGLARFAGHGEACGFSFEPLTASVHVRARSSSHRFIARSTPVRDLVAQRPGGVSLIGFVGLLLGVLIGLAGA